MLLRYLALPAFLVELTLAVSNSSSSSTKTDSTSTIQLTSFLTVTATATGSGNPYSNATGLEAASSCNQAKQDWVDDLGRAYASNTTFQTSTISVSYTVIRSGWIETIGPTEVYTLCDGYPRMNASTEYKTSDTTPATTIWSTFTTETEVYTNVSAPTCTIGPRDCRVLQAEYTSSSKAYDSYVDQFNMNYTGQTTWPSVASPTSPICGVPTIPRATQMTLPPAACLYNYATIQLLWVCFRIYIISCSANVNISYSYWPVSTIGNHICGNNWSTVEATPTVPGKPNTVVGFNTTFTSPTNYLVLSGAYAEGENFATGAAINGILPISSNSVSSMCAYQGGKMGPPEPMDYADFDAPIPKSKYLCQPACWTKPDYPQSWANSAYNITATENVCSTIYEDVYRPALQYTNGVGLDFDGLKCSFEPGTDGIFYDPPSALQQVQSAIGPSTPNSPGPTTTPRNDPQTTPARPIPTIPTALPQTTGGGDDSPQPTQPNTSDPSGDAGGDDSSDPSDGNNGGNSDNNDGGSNNDGSNGGGDDGSNGGPGSPSNPTPTQNVGGIIASIIGADPATVGQTSAPQDPSDPSDPSSNDSPPSNNDPASNGDSSLSDPSSDNGPSSDSVPSPDGDPSSSDPSSDSASGSGSGSSPDPSHGDHSILLTDSTDATITAIQASNGVVTLPSATLTPGQETSIADIGSVSVGANGIAQNGQPVATAPSAGSPAEAYVIDGETYTAAPSSDAVVIAPGETLTAGGSATVVNGTTFSLAATSDGGGGGALVVDGVTATRTSLNDGGSGTVSTSSGIPQQTGNAASWRLLNGSRVAIALSVVILARFV